MNHNRLNARKTRPQCGFVLIIGLLLLIVMSLIGVSMMSTTSLETRMAGGARETNIAFQAAEAALRDAEAGIETTTSIAVDFPPGSSAEQDPVGRVAQDTEEPDFFAAATWNADPNGGPIYSIEYLTGGPEGYPEMPALGQPRYIIKHIGDVLDEAIVRQSISVRGYGEQLSAPNVSIFRVTARGTSRDGSATTLLQSYYGRAY